MNHADLFLGHQASQGKKLAIMNVYVGDYKYQLTWQNLNPLNESAVINVFWVLFGQDCAVAVN